MINLKPIKYIELEMDLIPNRKVHPRLGLDGWPDANWVVYHAWLTQEDPGRQAWTGWVASHPGYLLLQWLFGAWSLALTQSVDWQSSTWMAVAVADQEEQETQQKSELDIRFTTLSYGAMEPGVMGRAKLAATACRPSWSSVTYSWLVLVSTVLLCMCEHPPRWATRHEGVP